MLDKGWLLVWLRMDVVWDAFPTVHEIVTAGPISAVDPVSEAPLTQTKVWADASVQLQSLSEELDENSNLNSFCHALNQHLSTN